MKFCRDLRSFLALLSFDRSIDLLALRIRIPEKR